MGLEVHGTTGKSTEIKIGMDLEKFKSEVQQMPTSVFNFIEDDRDKKITNNVELKLFEKLMNEAKDLEMLTVEPDEEGAYIEDSEDVDGNKVVTTINNDSKYAVTFDEKGQPISARYTEEEEATSVTDELIDKDYDGKADSRVTSEWINGNQVIQTDNDLDGKYDEKIVETIDAQLIYTRNENDKWVLKERVSYEQETIEEKNKNFSPFTGINRLGNP